MGSSTVPTHGKLGALYLLRPNGYKAATLSTGLNDATWGTGYNGAASGYFEVVIEHEGSPDQFKWRKNGGAWTENVAITGAAQTLSDTQTITFAATTGHTANDQWVIGNLKVEPTTVASSVAQITAAASRLLNPNVALTWTPTNGVQLLHANLVTGSGTFSGAPGVTTVTGNNGYIPASALQKVAYLIDWSLSAALDMADISAMGDNWKTALPGLAGGSGSFNAYFVANQTLFNQLAETASSGGEKYFLAQFFTWDASQDQTGDHYQAWVTIPSWNVSADINSVVKETVNFQLHGDIAFVADS